MVIYPEGTTTKEPDLWPMRGKTGVARLWLATGAPVIPVVDVGPASSIFDPRTRKLRLLPRDAGDGRAPAPPIDLSMGRRRRRRRDAARDHRRTSCCDLRDMLAEIRGGDPAAAVVAAATRTPDRARRRAER